MKKITLMAMLLMAGFTTFAQSTSFESSEGFTLGNLSGQNGWTVFASAPNVPVITNSQATDGNYSIHLIGTNIQANSGAFSPTFTSSQDVVITVDMFVASSPTSNPSDVDFVTQSPSQSLLTTRVKFSWDDTLQILDDLGTGVAFVTTSETVIRDTWFELKIEHSFSTGEILYYIDDTLIYTGTVFGGTNVEQMITLFDNYESDAYFDNIIYTDGIILSVKENKLLENNISLFPNPTKGDLNIKFVKDFGNTKIDIINITGQKVLSSLVTGFGNKTINTGILASGVYFVKIETETGDTTIKFIKN